MMKIDDAGIGTVTVVKTGCAYCDSGKLGLHRHGPVSLSNQPIEYVDDLGVIHREGLPQGTTVLIGHAFLKQSHD